MEFTLTTSPPGSQKASCVVVGVNQTRRLSPSARRIAETAICDLPKLIRSAQFDGKPGQTLLLNNVTALPGQRVLAVGCGKQDGCTAVEYRRACRRAMDALRQNGVRTAAIYLAEVEVVGVDLYWKVRQLVEAGHEATYRFDQCKGEQSRGAAVALRSARIGLNAPGQREAASRALQEGAAIGHGVTLSKDLGNLPSNICTPSYLGDRAKALAGAHRTMTARVRGEADLRKLGMETLLSVARGSREPAKLIELRYRGGRQGERPTVLVGKGVTFDSGGISLKPAAAMDEMKYDMCGAASVFGALAAAAEMELAHNVVGLVPATENLPGGSATKPGDIVTSMSGQTVEVLNTDAEGRLILCDTLTYAARLEPDTVIDVATLTGACVIALGAHASGMFTNHEPLGSALRTAGEVSGDRIWPLPLWEEYAEALKSNFADLANVGGREAGAVTAASFLSHFTTELRWAHLDIAGTAWRGGKQKGATGRPVPLLTQYLLDRAAALAATRADAG